MDNSLLLRQLFKRGLIWFGEDPPIPHPPFEKAESSKRVLTFGISQIDSKLPEGGLAFGAFHEWALKDAFCSKKDRRWYPPLSIVSTLILNALPPGKTVAWVGKICWPTANSLKQISIRSFREDFLFLDPPDKDKRIWSIAKLLHSPSFFGVMADGSGLNIIASRRIHLATRETGSLAMLFLPPWEIERPSAARTKWIVVPLPSEGDERLWRIELLRARGLCSPLAWSIKTTTVNTHGQISLRLLAADKERSRSSGKAY